MLPAPSAPELARQQIACAPFPPARQPKLTTFNSARPRPLHRDPAGRLTPASSQRVLHAAPGDRPDARSALRTAPPAPFPELRPRMPSREPITVSYSASRTMPGKCSHSCPRAAFLPSLPLALFFVAASSSYPTRSSERLSIAATQISTTLRTSVQYCHLPRPAAGCGAKKLGLGGMTMPCSARNPRI